MSDVKRYTCEYESERYRAMVVAEDGGWVRWEDYEHLQRELAELRPAAESWESYVAAQERTGGHDSDWISWSDHCSAIESLRRELEAARPPTWREVEKLAERDGIDMRVYVQALHKKVRDQQHELARLHERHNQVLTANRLNAQTVREQQAEHNGETQE